MERKREKGSKRERTAKCVIILKVLKSYNVLNFLKLIVISFITKINVAFKKKKKEDLKKKFVRF